MLEAAPSLQHCPYRPPARIVCRSLQMVTSCASTVTTALCGKAQRLTDLASSACFFLSSASSRSMAPALSRTSAPVSGYVGVGLAGAGLNLSSRCSAASTSRRLSSRVLRVSCCVGGWQQGRTGMVSMKREVVCASLTAQAPGRQEQARSIAAAVASHRCTKSNTALHFNTHIRAACVRIHDKLTSSNGPLPAASASLYLAAVAACTLSRLAASSSAIACRSFACCRYLGSAPVLKVASIFMGSGTCHNMCISAKSIHNSARCVSFAVWMSRFTAVALSSGIPTCAHNVHGELELHVSLLL
jgi:hypothetical protein